jgi:hypothetical protein
MGKKNERNNISGKDRIKLKGNGRGIIIPLNSNEGMPWDEEVIYIYIYIYDANFFIPRHAFIGVYIYIYIYIYICKEEKIMLNRIPKENYT